MNACARDLLRAVILAITGFSVLLAVVSPAQATGYAHEISGYVRDTFDRPVAGAVVQVYSDCGYETTTDAAGRYTNCVYGGPVSASAPASFSKLGFVTQSKTVHYGSVTSNNDVTLRFDLTASRSPAAFRSGGTLALQATSPTPVVVGGTGARVIAQPPTGLRILLTQGQTDGGGWTSWSGNYTPPSGTLDGTYTIKLCAIETTFPGNCDQAQLVGPPSIATVILSLTYQVDSTPPTVSSTSPSRFGDVLAISTVSVTWDDFTSGLEPSSMLMWIDGASVPTTVSGSTISANATGLQPGVHLAKTQATDKAGNGAADTFLFTRVAISGSPGMATLAQQIESVSPGSATVRFGSPAVDIERTTETINATTRVGLGTATRQFSLGTTTVTFRNSLGSTSVVSVSVPSATESHDVAAISPSATTLAAVIPAHRVSIPDIVVNVPAGYNGPGATATLALKAVPLGTHVLSGGAFLSGPLPSRSPVLGTIGVCLSGTSTGGYGNCEVDPQAGVVIGTGAAGDLPPVYVPTDQIDDASANSSNVQTCAGCDQGSPVRPKAYAVFALQCPTVTITETRNLCTGEVGTPSSGPWRVHLNAWLYSESGQARYPLWQQNHAVAGTAACPNGLTGQAEAKTYRLVNNVTTTDGSGGLLFAGTWDDPNNRRTENEVVYLGRLTGTNRDNPLVPNNGIPYQLSNESSPPLIVAQQGGYLPVRTGVAIGPRGEELPQPGGATTGWQWAPGDLGSDSGLGGNLQLFSGTEYRIPSVEGAYGIASSIAFQFVLDTSNCA